VDEIGPLTRKVMQYQDTVRQLVPTVKTPEDWAPLASLIAIDRFERIGTFLDVQNWQQYTEMLSGWAQSVDSSKRPSDACPSCQSSFTSRSKSGTSSVAVRTW